MLEGGGPMERNNFGIFNNIRRNYLFDKSRRPKKQSKRLNKAPIILDGCLSTIKQLD